MRCGELEIDEKPSPNELWASDFEALEVSGAPRGDQESLKEVFKSSKVTIHGVSQVIMSPQGAVGSPQKAPKELLESQNEGQSSPEELHRACRELREPVSYTHLTLPTNREV